MRTKEKHDNESSNVAHLFDAVRETRGFRRTLDKWGNRGSWWLKHIKHVQNEMLQTCCNPPNLTTFCASLYPYSAQHHSTIRYLTLNSYELR